MSDAFSPSQFNAVTGKIRDGLHEAALKLDELPPKVSAALDHFYIPDFVKDAVTWFLNKIAGLTHTMLEKLGKILEGVAAPLAFSIDSAK
jgi:CheY-specific phosphatase CheX